MWVTSRVRSLSRFSEKSRLLAVFLLILWKGLSWDTFFSKSLWTNRYFFQFHVPGARPQDSHHTLLLVIDTRSRPTRNSWGLKLKKKNSYSLLSWAPRYLGSRFMGRKAHFLSEKSSHGTQSEKVNPKQVFVFYILYSWNDDIEYYIIYIYTVAISTYCR